MDTANYV